MTSLMMSDFVNQNLRRILSEAGDFVPSEFGFWSRIPKPKIEKIDFGNECFFGFRKNGEPYLVFVQVKQHLKKVFNLFSEDHLRTLIEKLNISFVDPTVDEQQALLPYVLVQDLKLISLTDSERLLGIIQTLIGKKEVFLNSIKPHLNSAVVEHYCFGGNSGRFYFELPRESRRIECSTCFSLFYPVDFVRHSHFIEKGKTVQWGFDPANWRNFLWIVSRNENNSNLSIINEKLALDLNDSNLNQDPECPVWAEIEDVINTNSTSYSPMIIEMIKCGKFKEIEIRAVKELFEKTIDSRLRTLIAEREQLLNEIEILKTELRKIENNLPRI